MTPYRKILLTLVLMVTATSLAAATTANWWWVNPATTPNTDVTCTSCPGTANGKLTPGYPAPLQKWIGRFCDSQAIDDFQAPFRTARARRIWSDRAHNRIYMTVGSGVFVYDMDRFFSRLAGGEKMVPITVVPVAWDPNSRKGETYEQVLKFDEWFYAEAPSSGWTTFHIDGQDRLGGVDYDDQGYVYMAYEAFMWGIAKDGRTDDGAMMSPEWQRDPMNTQPDEVTPEWIAVVKSPTNGDYYALVSNRSAPPLNIWDVTNRQNPTKLPSNSSIAMINYAKTTNMDKIAIVTETFNGDGGSLQVWNTDGLVNHGSPIYTIKGSTLGGTILAVASDGTNFYFTTDNSTKTIISSLTPITDANGVVVDYRRQDFQTLRASSSQTMRYGDGYLILGCLANSAQDLRIFKVSNGTPTEIDTRDASGRSWFQRYYVATTTPGYTAPAAYMWFYDSDIIKRNGTTYLVLTGGGLADVFTLQVGDSLTVTNNGVGGHANPSGTVASATPPYYGDPVTFTSATSNPAGMSVYYNYGNPEAGTLTNSPANPIQTGTPVTYQYQGLTSASQLPTTRTVTAANADNSINGTVSVTLQKPTAAIKVTGYSPFITAPTATPNVPIIVGDSFYDTSDGTVEGHYAAFNIDGTTTKALPGAAVSVGACKAQHTLIFDAHYGPYAGSGQALLGTNGDLPVGIHNFVYSVTPFAASMAMTGQSTTLTFAPSVRVTSDTSVLSAAQAAALQYRWELVDANNAPVTVSPAPPSGSVSQIQSWVLNKSAITGRNMRAHLVITSGTPATGACAGLNLETYQAYSGYLNGPDAAFASTTAATVCPNGGPTCTFSLVSPSNTDPVADGWQYQWSVSPSSGFQAPATSTATFTPTFSQGGTYTVSVTVTNAIGSKQLSQQQTITKFSNCGTIQPGTNLYIAYQGTSGTCAGGSPNPTCTTNDSITFWPQAFGYDLSCGTHTFSWNFGDGTKATGQNPPAHRYSGLGSYTVTCDVTPPGGLAPAHLSTTVTITTGGCTSNCPCTSNCGCPTMQPGTNVYITFFNSNFTCSTTNPNCSVGSALAFDVGSLAYPFSCATHNFSWNFGDGATSSDKSPTHTYQAAGTYNVVCTVNNGSQSVNLTQTIVVSGGGCTTGCNSCGTIVPGTNMYITFGNGTSGCTFTSPSCAANTAIAFNAQTFQYDPTCATHTYQWDFGDGANATGKSPSHTYAKAGNYTVTCTVNNGAQTAVLSQAITVTGPACTTCGTCQQIIPGTSIFATYTGSKSGCTQISGACTTCDTLSFSVATFQYDLTCATHTFQWDFGDGSPRTTGSTAVHTFPAAGAYTVKLIVGVNGTTTEIPTTVNIGSCSGVTGEMLFDFAVAQKTVTVGNTTIAVPDDYVFTAFAIDGKATSSTYQWDFGDGATQTGSAAQVVHQFADSKNYTVTLTVPGFGSVKHTLLVHHRPSSH